MSCVVGEALHSQRKPVVIAFVFACLVGRVAAAAAEPASSNDVVTPAMEQPKRSAKDAARVAAAENALIKATATAKSVGTVKAACSGVPALVAALGELSRVRPPAGFERELAGARAELATQVDHLQGTLCTDPHPDPGVVEDVRQWLGKRMRSSFGKLQRIGKAPAGSTEARGRAALDAQLEVLDDQDRLAATFAPQAFVLTPSGVGEAHEPDAGLLTIADLNPHAEIDSVTFDHFMSGSAGQVAWFAADVHITVTSHEPEYPPSTSSTTVRAIELLDGAASWQVTVAAFTRVQPMSRARGSAAHTVTTVGPLTSLLLSPPTLADALDSNAMVYGSDPGERGLGTQNAKALLAKWKKLAITLDTAPGVHEVHGAAYGYATANVRVVVKPGGPAYDLSAFVLALPAGDGKWSVIGASFGAR